MQTINLLNTVEYFMKTGDIINALKTLEGNLETLTPYFEIPADLIDAIKRGEISLQPKQCMILSKFFLLKGDETNQLISNCVFFALKGLSKGETFENDFYMKSILFKMMEVYSKICHKKKTNEPGLKKYILDLIENSPISLSLIGYLLEINEFSLAHQKFLVFLEKNLFEVSHEILEFLEILKCINSDLHKEIILSLNHNKLKGPLEITTRLICDTIDALGTAEETAEFLQNLKYPLSHYAAFYLYNRKQTIDEKQLEVYALMKETNKKSLQLILCGRINSYFLDFMVMNNQTNFKLLESMGKAGCPYFGFCHSIMNAHTTNDSFFRTNRFNRSQDWNRFIEMGGLGVVHTSQAFEILAEILPSTSYTGEASALLSLGLITSLNKLYSSNFVDSGNRTCIKEEDNKQLVDSATTAVKKEENPSATIGEIQKKVNNILSTSNGSNYFTAIKEAEGFFINFINSEVETYLFGACLGLATVKYGSCDQELLGRFKELFNRYSTLSQETAAYAIGVLYAGSGDATVINFMQTIRDSTEFVRAKRAINLGIGMIQCNNGQPICSDEKEEWIYSLGFRYTNTADLNIIKTLLGFVNDGNDDIKRQAVISLAAVIGYDQQLIEEILIPLATSHSFFVRSAVAICLGFFSSEITDLRLKAVIINLLEALMYDLEDLVKQSACIGVGMSLIQFNGYDFDDNSKQTVNYKRIVEKLNSMISSRNEPKCSKIGAALGRAVMEVGGKSAILSLRNISGKIDHQRVCSFFLFVHSWYWNPMYNFITHLILPTPVYKFNEDLDIVNMTGISVKYRDQQIFIQDVKRSRKFKRVKNEVINDEIREVEKELESQERMNYSEMLKRGMRNGIIFGEINE
ncbi:hypothetical protein NUSPORA_01024 [Nucleospora cyclopteri]